MDFKRKHIEMNTGRFYWGDEVGNAWIDITTLTMEQMAKITEQCTETIIDFPKDPETGQMVRVETEKPNREKRGLMMICQAITAWDGFSVDGNKLECTDENKEILLNDFPDFGKWVLKCVNEHRKQTEKLYGGTSEAKNSKSM